MRWFLLVAVMWTLGGCAFMNDEDRDFYGRGWVKPTDLDRPAPLPAGKPTGKPVPPTQGADPAWDVPGSSAPAANVPAVDVPPARPY